MMQPYSHGNQPKPNPPNTQETQHDDSFLTIHGSHQSSQPTQTATAQSQTAQPQTVPNSNDEAAHQAITAVLKEAIGEANFQHWLAERCRHELTETSLIVHVSNPFIANWLLKRFRSQFTKAASELLGPSAQFELRVDESLQAIDEAAAKTNSNQTKVQQELVSAPTPTKSRQPRSTYSGDSTSSDHARPLAVKTTGRRRFRRFDTIVEGECNKLSLLAARQVAEAPGELFNPLYVHGPTGCGKTHLLEAIYSETKRDFPTLNVMYISSEAFTNYFLQALESRSVASFRQKFRNVDVLLIDNIEFLDNKKATQEEFLHTVVQLLENGGQLIVSGDRHPRLLTKHREEVTTRFMSGMVCRMEAPDETTRKQVTKLLALPHSNCFTKEALNYVAKKCRKNIREIQGAINCLQGHYQLSGEKITLSRAREILGDLERECRRLVRIADVEKIICDMFGVTVTDLRSKSRRKAISAPRALAMYISRKLTGSAYREIGGYFGGRDHSTVVAAERRVKQWIENDEPLKIPTACKGQNVSEMIHELEEILMTMSA